MVLRTARLILREPRDDDLEAFAAMSADADVMRFFPWLMDREASAAHLARVRAHFAEHGFGRWAVEAPGIAPFVGLVGLMRVTFEAAFTPAVEIGWRIARPFWRRGYASEAAEAAIADGFGRLGLDEIVAYTVPANAPSRALMRRLGMVRDPACDLDHPAVPEGHPLRRHVVYRLRRETEGAGRDPGRPV